MSSNHYSMAKSGPYTGSEAAAGSRTASSTVSSGTSPDGVSRLRTQTGHSRPSLMQQPLLVLNATFEPINVTAVRRAMALILKRLAQVEEHNHTEVHSPARPLNAPSLIPLQAYRHIHHH